jgi:hypothetical protein
MLCFLLVRTTQNYIVGAEKVPGAQVSVLGRNSEEFSVGIQRESLTFEGASGKLCGFFDFSHRPTQPRTGLSVLELTVKACGS